MKKVIIAVQIYLHQMVFAHGRKGEMMDDTISRREAIKVVRASCHWDYPWASKSPNDIMSDAVNALKGLPSAQPEIKTDGDMISRQQTIDALMQEFKRIPTNSIRAKIVVEKLPSAQPETNCSEIPNGSDTISRRAAIDAVLKLTYADGAYGYTDAKDLVDSLENLPSAQPEIKTDGDTISRQAAIDALKNRWKKTRNYEGIGDDIAEECELYLKQVPSAKPERKTGRWIFAERKRLVDETDDGAVYRTEKWWSCSECGYAKGYQTSKPSSNYCEKCGAKMKEGR